MVKSIQERIATVSLDGMTEEQLKVMRSLAYFAESHADRKAQDYRFTGFKDQAESFDKLADSCADLWDRCVTELRTLSRG